MNMGSGRRLHSDGPFFCGPQLSKILFSTSLLRSHYKPEHGSYPSRSHLTVGGDAAFDGRLAHFNGAEPLQFFDQHLVVACENVTIRGSGSVFELTTTRLRCWRIGMKGQDLICHGHRKSLKNNRAEHLRTRRSRSWYRPSRRACYDLVSR